jgi:hypothetical protein
MNRTVNIGALILMAGLSVALLTGLAARAAERADITVGGRPVAWADYYVAPHGKDTNPGTDDAPFATLARARDAVRTKAAPGLNADVLVFIREVDQATPHRLGRLSTCEIAYLS